MIDKAMETLRKEILASIARMPDLNVHTQDAIYLTHVVKDDGGLVIPKESMGLTLINIDEERVNKPQSAVIQGKNGRVAHTNPEIRLNLYILFAPNFTSYTAGLKYLSGIISFFQSKNVFSPENTPGLDPALHKLIVDMHTLTLEQQNHLWGYLGSKYLPSIVYKVRVLSLQEGHAKDDQSSIGAINMNSSAI